MISSKVRLYKTALYNRLDALNFQVTHLSHNDDLPKGAFMVISCVPAVFQLSMIEKFRNDGFEGIYVDTSQEAEIPDSELPFEARSDLGLKNDAFELKEKEIKSKICHGYIKSFGDVSAFDITELDRPLKTTFSVSSSYETFKIIAKIQKLMNFNPVLYSCNNKNFRNFIFSRYNRCFPRSLFGTIYGFIVFVICFLYQMFRKTPFPFGNGHSNYGNLMVSIGNTTFAWASVWCLAGVYIFGCIAKLFPVFLKSNLLINLLNSRKQLGLIGALFGAVHLLMMMTIYSPMEFSSYYEKDEETGEHSLTHMLPHGQAIIMFGVFTTVALIALTISSFAGEYSRKEWYWAQSFLGLLVLLFAASHVTAIGLPPKSVKSGWRDLFPSKSNGWPSASIFCALALYLAIFLRFIVFVFELFGKKWKQGEVKKYSVV